MRVPHLLSLVLVSAVACSSDSKSGSDNTPSTPTAPSSNGYSVTVDSAFASRTAMVGTSVPGVVHVSLNGQPASGVTVTWTVSIGGGTANPTTSVTDATGTASTTWTLNDTVRVATLTGGITGVSSANLVVTSTPGPVAGIARVGADSVAVVAGGTTFLTVRAIDKSGNSVPGVSIGWTASGGALTTPTTITGSSGNGQAVFSTEATRKSYTVTATISGIGALTFKVVGL